MRKPRTSGPAGKCISIMPDGTVEFFKPKKAAKRTELVKIHNGKYVLVDKKLR